jgi:hypothetical protein
MSKALFPVTIWSLITLLGLAVSQYAMIYAGLLESYMLPGMRGPYSSTLLYAFLRAGCSGNASCSHAKILGESFMPQPIKHLECYKALGVTKHPLNASPCFHRESLSTPLPKEYPSDDVANIYQHIHLLMEGGKLSRPSRDSQRRELSPSAF